MTVASAGRSRPPLWRRVGYLLPLMLFLALAGVFLIRLESGGDLERVPSALIGKVVPDQTLPPLDGTGLPGLAAADFEGRVTVLNVFASWCGPCRVEHPIVMELGEDPRFRLVGLNHKDQPANAVRWLGDLGNPYAAIGVDRSGRPSLEWGIYGVPETFVIGPDGTIRYKFVGPLSRQSLQDDLMPAIEAALAGAG